MPASEGGLRCPSIQNRRAQWESPQRTHPECSGPPRLGGAHEQSPLPLFSGARLPMG